MRLRHLAVGATALLALTGLTAQIFPPLRVQTVGPTDSSSFAASTAWVRLYTRLGFGIQLREFANADGTDQAAAIQAVIDTCSTGGGCTITLAPGFLPSIASTIVWKPGVHWEFKGGAGFSWIGGSSDVVVFDTPTTGPLDSETIKGVLRIKYGTGITGDASLVRIRAALHLAIEDGFLFEGSSNTAIGLDLYARNTTGADSYGTRNIANCTFGALRVPGTIGTVRRMTGLDPAPGNLLGGPQVVTLNTFGPMQVQNAYIAGDVWHDWADSNEITGYNRVGMIGPNSTGVIFSARDTTTYHGVYNNQYTSLAVDAFGTGAGRVGIRINAAHGIRVLSFLQGPPAEGGQVIASPHSYSYSINTHPASMSLGMAEFSKGFARRGASFDTMGEVTLAGDTATSFALDPTGEGRATSGLLALSGSDPIGGALLYVRPRPGSALVTQLAKDLGGTYGAYLVTTTGILTGTTGANGKVTVSAHTDGKIYIENRLGYSIKVNATVLSAVSN